MNKDNLDYLQKGLENMGFEDKLNKELKANIEKSVPEFKLDFAKDFQTPRGPQTVDFTLDFRKSETTDMYFFNRYKATIDKDTVMDEVSQTFYVNKNKGVTIDEAHNLLNGRSVNKDLYTKEGKPYNAWVQLDFNETDKHDNFRLKQYSTGYGFDLNKTLEKYPIKELGDQGLKDLVVKSLKKGNVQDVTFTKDGKDEKMYIEANPQFKSLKVYDSTMQKIYQDNSKKEGQSQREPEKKQEKTEKKDADEGDRKQKSSKKRSLSR